MKKGVHLALTLAVVVVVTGVLLDPALAGWSHYPAENSAISTNSGPDTLPAVIDDGSGGFFIVWMNDDIYMQRIDVNGNPLWNSDGMAITTGGGMFSPRLVSDGMGGAIVAWQKGEDGSGGVYVQRVDSSGNVLWSPGGEIICNESGQHTNLRLVSDGMSGAIVVWQDGRYGEDDLDIYAQRVYSDQDGDLWESWGGNGMPVCAAAASQENPQVVGDGTGGAVIVWQDGREEASDIFAQRVDGDGNIQWAIDGNPVNFTYLENSNPEITGDGNGGAIISWKVEDEGDEGIYVQRFSMEGGPLWNDFWPDNVLAYAGAASKNNKRIVSDNANGAVVAWLVNGIEGSIYAQRFDSGGNAVWAANGVNVVSAGSIDASDSLSMIGDGNHGAVIAWADQRNGSDYDVYGQRVEGGNGSALWDINGSSVSTATGHQRFPVLVGSGSEGVVAVWQDKRSGEWDVYGQKLALADGSLPVTSPKVTTAAVSGQTSTTATVGGEVLSDGGSTVSSRGICWGMTPEPQQGGNCMTAGSGSGAFAGMLTGLTPNTTYHVRAFATNEIGVSYGSDIVFTTTNKYSLNVAFSGNGSVTWNGTTCNGACTYVVDPGSSVQIHASPLPYYLFSSWSGACSGNSPDCTVEMNSASKSVTANFIRNNANSVRIKLPKESRYPSIGEAIRLDSDGTAVVDAWGWEFTENPTFNRGAFTFKGGWDQGYTSRNGMSTINGTVTVKSGSLTVDNLTIR